MSVSLAACTGSSGGAAIDAALGIIKSDGPVLTALPGFTVQQTNTLDVDVSNVKEGAPGSDEGMSYVCTWDQTVDGSVTSTSTCDTLPGTLAQFNAGDGKLKWTPSTSELGDFEIKIKGTNTGGNDSRVFSVGVRLKFDGLDSISNVLGDRMDLNWTANPAGAGYQIMKRNPDGTFALFQTITNPSASTVTLTSLTPLTSYTWRVYAIDVLGNNDGNTVSQTAVTTDLIRLEVASSATQLSPGQTATLTAILKDSGGNILPTTGLAMTFFNDASGTGDGTFSPTTDNGDGSYTATFTATSPGTVTKISASIPQYHFVQVKPNMHVRPLQIEILASGNTVNPTGSINLTAKIRDFAGNLMTTSGHGLSFNYSGGTSTGTFGAVTDNGNGTYSGTFTGSTAGTAVTFGATISTTSTSYATTSVTVQPWAVEITSSLADVSVTRTSIITGRIKDWQGNYLTAGGKGMTISISGVPGIASVGSTTDVGDGSYTATLTGGALGTVVVTASISQSHTVTVSATVQVRRLRVEFLTSAANLMPGGVATLTGRVKDWQGNIVGVGGHAMTMSSAGGTSTGTISAITDNNNGTYGATFTAGSAGTAISISGTINESYQVDLSPTITVNRWRVEVSSSASSVATGQTLTLTAVIKDYTGTQASTGGQSVFFSFSGGTSAGSLGSVTDNNNGTYTVVFTGITPGTAITATASLSTSYQVDQTASIIVEAIKLAVSVSQNSMNPGDGVTVTAQVQNQAGTNLTTGSYTIGFSYSGGTSTGSFSSVINLGLGLYQATFTGASAGTAISITANASVSYTVVTPLPTITVVPWKIELTSAAANIPVGQTTTITGRIRDWQNNYLTSGGDNLAMSLVTAGRGSLSAVTDNSNGTYTATFTASGVGTTDVTASLSESYNVTVYPTLTVSPIHLTVAVSQASLNPGDPVTVTAQVKDSLGNNLTTGSYTIGFSVSGGTSTGSFGSTTGLGLGLYQATFTGSNAGTAVTVAANANVSYVVNTPQPTLTVVPWKIELTAGQTAISVGQSTVITGRIKDWQNNFLTSGGKNMTMSLVTPGIGSISSVTDNGDGTYAANFVASGVGSTLVSAGLSESNTVTVAPTMVVSSVHIALSAVQTSLNPGDSVTVLAQVKDASGNNLTTGSYAIGFSYSGGTSTGTFGSTLSLGLGLYSVQFSGIVAGTATTVSANANMTYTVDNTVNLTVVPWNIEITASTTDYVIYETGTLTARIKDWQGNFLTAGGKSLNMSLVTAGVGLAGGTTDNSDGTYTASFTASASGSTSVTANISQSYTVTVAPTLTVEKVYIDVTVDSPEIASSTVNSGSLIPVTARLKDSLGNLVTGTGYVVSFTASGGTSTVNQSVVTEVSPGIFRANFQGVLAGTPLTITAATGISHQLNSSATLQVNPGTAISAANSNLTTTATSVRSGETVTLTATLKDAAGNVMPGLTGVTFSNSGGTSTGTYGATTAVGNGVYTSVFTGVTPGTATTVKASYGGVDVSTTVSEVVTAGAPSKLTVAGPASVLANTCTSSFQLSFFDTNNNPTTLATAKTFTFTGAGYAKFYSDAGCTTEIPQLDVSGGLATSQLFYMKSYDPATLSLTFTTAGISQATAHSIVVGGTVNWLGVAGVIDSLSSSNISNFYFGSGKYDGQFQTPWGLVKGTISSIDYLFVTDTTEHTITKIRLSDGVIIGKIGRIGGSLGAIPTGGGANCTGLTYNGSKTTSGWCTGGIYQSGNAEGAFNTPAGITFLGGYLYVADNANHRIVKIDADTGAWVGWSGRISGTMPNAGTCANETGTSSTWCLGASGTSTASPQTGLSPNGNVAYGTTATGTNGGNEYRSPSHMATDGTDIFVSDSGNNRLVKINPANGRLLGWMGWIYDNTGLSCTSTNSHTAHTLQVATQFTDSWCTGGRSTHLGATQVLGTDPNWAKINVGWNQIRAMEFYSHGGNSFMYISDNGWHKIIRYTKSEGYYRGWTGRGFNSSIAVPAAPAPIAALMTGTCSSTANSYTMGWCYGGGSQAASNTNGLNTPFGIRAYTESSTGYMVIANSAAVNVSKLNIETGVFQGYIGRVSSQPTGGASGCSTTSSGSVTPGWCTGGTTTHGFGSGSFSRINTSGNGADGMTGIEIDGTTLFTTDFQNNRIAKHNLTTGAALGSAGFRVSLLPTKWAKGYTGAPGNGSVPISIVVNRDLLFTSPFGVSIDDDYMYVTDSSNHRIKRYNWLDGSFEGWSGVMSLNSPTGGDEACVGAVVGGMTPGWCKGGASTSTGVAGFNNPRDMVSDGTNLYVADNSNHRLVKILKSNGLFLGWMGGVSGTNNPSDSLYDQAGCQSATGPNTTPHFCLGGVSTNSNKPNGFNAPRAIDGFIDPNDGYESSPGVPDNHYYVIVADSGNARIQKIDTRTGQSLGWVGRVNTAGTGNCATAGAMSAGWCTDGVVSTANTTSPSANVNNGYMNTPSGIWVDKSSYPYIVYVADNGNGSGGNARVLKFNAISGAYLGWIGMINSTTAHGCATAPSSPPVQTPGWCTGGTVNTVTLATATNGNMYAPHGVSGDSNYIYVTDSVTHRILRFNKASGTFAGWKGRVLVAPTDSAPYVGSNPASCLGLAVGAITPDWCYNGTAQPGYAQDPNTPSLAVGLDTPRGITVKGNYLVVVDSGNNRVVQIPKCNAGVCP